MIYKISMDTWSRIRVEFEKDADTWIKIQDVDNMIEQHWGLRAPTGPVISYDYEVVDERKFTMFLLRWL